MATPCRTGVGRIVWGNPAKSTQKMNRDTKPPTPVLKNGQPVEQWAFGVAFPHAEFERDIWPLMSREISTVYPSGVPGKFSYKFKKDTDIDDQGKPYGLREGYAGCYVLTISTEAFAPPIFRFNGQSYDQWTDIKCGDFVALSLNFQCQKPQDPTHTPSIYVNPQGVEYVGWGQPIVAGPDAQTMFGGVRHTLPPGASATPLQPSGAPGMPQGGVSSGIPGQPAPGTLPPGMMPGMAPAGAPAMPGAAPGMPGALPPGMVPGMPGGMPAPAAPAPVYTPAHDYTAGLIGGAPPAAAAPAFAVPPGYVLVPMPGAAFPGLPPGFGLTQAAAPAAPAGGGYPGMPGMPPR